MSSLEEKFALRARIITALTQIIESAAQDVGPVAKDEVGGITRTYATVADRLMAVNLLITMGAI